MLLNAQILAFFLFTYVVIFGNFQNAWDLVSLLWIWKDQFLDLKILETLLFNKPG